MPPTYQMRRCSVDATSSRNKRVASKSYLNVTKLVVGTSSSLDIYNEDTDLAGSETYVLSLGCTVTFLCANLQTLCH